MGSALGTWIQLEVVGELAGAIDIELIIMRWGGGLVALPDLANIGNFPIGTIANYRSRLNSIGPRVNLRRIEIMITL